MKTTKRLLVEVTANDIRLGRRGDAYKCAVTRAVKRASKDKVCFTNIETIGIAHLCFDCPKKVALWINKFDIDKKLVKPFFFRLGAPRA